MATEVSICNQALLLLGANTVISLDDDTTEAKLCKAHYQPIRDAVIEAHNWTFATRWMTLPALATAPEGEYANAFPLPSNVLRVIFVGESYKHPVDEWRVEGNNIVMNQISCKCQVIYQIVDPAKFSPLFVQALVSRLAADMAIALTNSRSLMETHLTVYQTKMKEAFTRDGIQGRSRKITSKWANRARTAGPSSNLGPYV